jgi:general transcriptional corepressor CYC8
MSEVAKEEPALRKMEVDENYDDDGEDNKPERTSPPSANGGISNGMVNGQPKVESSS